MAIGRITGPMLFSNLDRQGVNLAIDANLVYADVTNRQVGISNSNPQYTLDVNGNAHIGNLYILGNTINSDTGKINLGSISNVVISGGVANSVVTSDGLGNLSFTSIISITSAITGSIIGNLILLGSNTAPALTSNAVTLTTTTTVTDAIAELNFVLGKLVPPSPPTFPAGQSITITTATTAALMSNFVQTDNSGWGNLSVAGGTAVSVVRSATYTTSTLTTVGPGDSGTVTVYLNGVAAGSRTMTPGTDNGTYGNLVIALDQDYHNVVSTVTAGFWQSFNASATGSSTPAGWNRVYIGDTAGGNTNNVTWYYDNAAPTAPAFSATSMVVSSNVVTYSSTIPMFTSAAGFTLRGSVQNLSGDTYPNSVNLISASAAAGAFATPALVTYATAGVTTPITRSNTTVIPFTTTSNIISGFGTSIATVGPTTTVNNSYNSTVQTFTPGNIILYKTGTTTNVEETSIVVTSVGTGSGNAYRIANPGSTDTPAYTGNEAAFNSQTGPFYTYDATNVAAKIQFDQTNYSTGYLPIGPNLTGQGASQYFTFKFVRTAVSKFNISWTGTVAGMWVALPGQSDTYSGLSGWYTLSSAYAGSGIPGTGVGGNGSNGCSLGGFALTGGSYTATFGTLSSTNSTNNEIYVRIKLTSGQSITALSILAATN